MRKCSTNIFQTNNLSTQQNSTIQAKLRLFVPLIPKRSLCSKRLMILLCREVVKESYMNIPPPPPQINVIVSARLFTIYIRHQYTKVRNKLCMIMHDRIICDNNSLSKCLLQREIVVSFLESNNVFRNEALV